MEIHEGWRGFDAPPTGHSLDNTGKPVVHQSFAQKLNLWIIQVSESGNSLVLMPTPPAGPSPIIPFVTTYYRITIQSFCCQGTRQHRWELPGNYPVLTMVMVIYHYVERIWRILVTPIFCITYTTMNKYYPGEPVNIHIQSLINIILENI